MEPSANAVVAAAAENDRRLCKTCQMEFKLTEGRQHGSSFECTTCSSADRLLRRQLGQVAFFKQLHAEKEKRDGKLNWETVKAQLITSLTTKQITENSTNVNTKFLPLGVYLNKGWPKEVVEACPSEYSDTYGCWTYKVPVKSQDWKVVNQEIRERILVQERQATAVRGKKKAKGKDGEEDDGELDLPAAAASSGKKDANPEAEEKKAAKQQASTEKKNKAFNQKVQMLAAKNVGILSQDLSALDKLMGRVPEHELDGQVLELCQKTQAKLKEWIAAAKLTLQEADHAQALSGEEKLKELPFEAGDVKTQHLSVGEILKTLRKSLPVRKAKAAGKAKAAAAAPAGETADENDNAENKPKRRRTKQTP
jgi:hypothetical protein